MVQTREKFATQLDKDLLIQLRGIAKSEGRQIQALVEEAITNLIEEREQGQARSHVMTAYQKSHAKYASLYEKLAK